MFNLRDIGEYLFDGPNHDVGCLVTGGEIRRQWELGGHCFYEMRMRQYLVEC
jgi:hypothetical protein